MVLLTGRRRKIHLSRISSLYDEFLIKRGGFFYISGKESEKCM